MRNYAPQLVKAYSLAKSLFVTEILQEERELALDYDREKSNQAIILYSQEQNKVLRLPYFMRFKIEYAKAIRRKIWKEIYPKVLGYKYFLFVTFDASITKYHSQKDAHEKIQKQWNSLLTRIRKKYNWVSVIKTVEWQDNGLGCHLHVLLCGLRFIPKKWIKKTWDKLEESGWAIQFEKIRKFENPKRAVAYILKYISKSLRKDDYIPLSLVINWALHLRSFSVSCRFSSLKTNSNDFSKSDWVFLGIMPLDLALSYNDSEILDYFEYG
jgi:hypothetical protein